MQQITNNKIHTLIGPSGGHQGYVGVSSEHVLYEKNYFDTIPEYEPEEGTLEDFFESKGVLNIMAELADNKPQGFCSVTMQFSVHGGITYSGCAYWDQKEYTPVNLTPELKKYVKVQYLLSRCGNELFSFYWKQGVRVHDYRHDEQWKLEEKINSDSLFARAWRVHQVYESLKNYPKPQLDHFKPWQWGYNIEGKLFYATEDDYWYFGWDSNHYGDTPQEFTQDRATEECESLSNQLFFYDNERNKYLMGEL